MSHDPRSPTDAADFDDDTPDGVCESCGDGMDMTDIDVESFEVFGQVLCADCSEAKFTGTGR